MLGDGHTSACYFHTRTHYFAPLHTLAHMHHTHSPTFPVLLFPALPTRPGEVVDIERNQHRTEVIVDEGINTVSYALDEALIYFGAALEDQDFERAVQVGRVCVCVCCLSFAAIKGVPNLCFYLSDAYLCMLHMFAA